MGGGGDMPEEDPILRWLESEAFEISKRAIRDMQKQDEWFTEAQRFNRWYAEMGRIFGSIRESQILSGVASESSVNEYFDHVWLQLIGIKP